MTNHIPTLRLVVSLARGACVWWYDPRTRKPLLRTRAGRLYATARTATGWRLTLKTAFSLLIGGILASGVAHGALSEAEAGRMVDCIYLVEGGAKARVPFGILSVKVNGYAEARRVYLNTVRNNYRRWEKAGKPGEFADFLGNVYCPASADPKGNANWRRNFKRLMR